AVHFRHHQITHDQIYFRLVLLIDGKGFLAVLRRVHRIAKRLQAAFINLAEGFFIIDNEKTLASASRRFCALPCFFGLLMIRNRKEERNGGSLSVFTEYINKASVLLYDAVGNRQPQSRTLVG